MSDEDATTSTEMDTGHVEKEDDRPGRIKWKEYYMAAAVLASKRSNDKKPNGQVGAVLVDRRKRIIGIGWHGMPTGLSDADMHAEQNQADELLESTYVCHAVANAFAFKTSQDIDGAELYTTLFPCNGCAKLITQNKIKAGYYLSDKRKDEPEFKASAKLLEMEKIDFHDFMKMNSNEFEDRNENPIILDFTFMDQLVAKSDGGPAPKQKYKSPEVYREKHIRPGRVTWEDFYMGMAILAAQRSNHPDIQIGAVLVDLQKRIVGTGWNGLPAGQTYSEQPKEAFMKKEGKHTYDVHAAANAIIFKTTPDIRGTKLYTTDFPCQTCAKLIIQSGVAEVHYLSDRKADEKSRDIFAKKSDMKVELREFKFGEFRRATPLELDFAYLDP